MALLPEYTDFYYNVIGGRSTMKQPYEIHLTIACDESTLDRFKEACAVVGVKPLLVQLGAFNTLRDVMTSSSGTYGPTELYHRVQCLIEHFRDEFCFDVIRAKIETAPWHPMAMRPVKEMDPSQYFESHIPVRISTITALQSLKEICVSEDMHLSSNAFKVNDEFRTIMITYRSTRYNYEEFPRVVKNKCMLLMKQGFDIEEPEVEYAIYDSNRMHDSKWLNLHTSN